MNKEYFLELAKYNQWANNKVIEWAYALTVDQWNQPMVSSFPSIADSVLHIVGVEKVWYDRLMKVENPDWLPFTFKGGKTETLSAWKNSCSSLIEFVEHLTNDNLNDLTSYKRINGEAFTQPVYEILSHVFNHSTYHRGQLVTLLRQVGFVDVLSTDLLLYYRINH
ncbi:MAG: DinB family protein [Saprospiraceae bacterium]|nr:DinB family protein [Saprospiraceae bacterium]